MQTPHPIEQLEKNLNYQFKNRQLLDNALRHSSFVNELHDKALDDNERFEFLGDAVLNLVIGDILMSRYSTMREGNLSRLRANLVNEIQLSELALKMDLGSYICLGKGELLTNGRNKKSILSDALEAVIAAVYLDDGFNTAFGFIERLFTDVIDIEYGAKALNDSKSLLQEYAQVSLKVMPSYKVIQESGPDHNKTFVVKVTVKDFETDGSGKSKKAAEQDAARKAIELMNLI